MVVQGDDYRVKFLRQKSQKQHPWKGKKWVLAEYDVQESKAIPAASQRNKQLPVYFKNDKKEIEVSLHIIVLRATS